MDNCIRYASIDSTQKEAKRLLRYYSDIKLPKFFLASHQFAGIGRRNKDWLTPKGNVAFSLLCSVTMKEINYYPIIVMVLFRKALIQCFPFLNEELKFKWPNDLFVKEKKISGILVENVQESFFCVGIGLNIYNRDLPACSIALEELGIKDCEILDIVKKFYNLYKECFLYSEAMDIDIQPFLKIWKKNLLFMKDEVTVTLPNGEIHQGQFLDVHESGAIMIKDCHNKIRCYHAAEVFVLKKGSKNALCD